MNSETALQNVQNFQQGMKNPEGSLIQSMNGAPWDAQTSRVVGQRAAVTGLRQAINNTTNLLGQIAPRNMASTANSNTTTAGAARISENQTRPIQAALEDQNQVYNDQMATYKPLLETQVRNAAGEQQQQTGELKRLSDIYDDTYAQEQADQARSNDERKRTAQEAASKRSASRSRSGGGGRAAAGVPARDAFNSDVQSLEGGMQSHGQMPNYEDAVRSLVGAYAGSGISPQEIGETVYNLYSRYGPAPRSKFYG